MSTKTKVGIAVSIVAIGVVVYIILKDPFGTSMDAQTKDKNMKDKEIMAGDMISSVASVSAKNECKKEEQDIKHCLFHRVNTKCFSGPSKNEYMTRKYDRWNPDCLVEGRGVSYLTCIRCCFDDGKSIPLCECNKKPGYTAGKGFYTFTELKDDEKCICKKKDDNTEQICVAHNNKCTASTGACSTDSESAPSGIQ